MDPRDDANKGNWAIFFENYGGHIAHGPYRFTEKEALELLKHEKIQCKIDHNLKYIVRMWIEEKK